MAKGVENEILAVQLYKAYDIICNNVVIVLDGIRIENFTNPDCVLEPKDASGKFVLRF